MFLTLLAAAFAQDDSLTYEGGLSGSGASYKAGKPVSISHSSGNIQVRCMDVDKLTARLQYTVFGSAEGPMESFGKGIGIAVYGDSNGGSVKTRVPSKTSGVARAQVDLVVNIPSGTPALTISQSGAGWTQVIGCAGTVKATAGSEGLYVGGPIAGFTLSASGGDVKVETEAPLTATSTASSPNDLTVVMQRGQGGKFSAKGAEVSVQATVLGTNEATIVSGDLGLPGPSISLSAKNKVTVTAP